MKLSRTLLIFLLLAGPVQADRQQLLRDFGDVRQDRAKNIFSEPLFIRSDGAGDSFSADIYAVLPHPFADVRGALARADEWCRFVLLNQNVKACTWRPGEEGERLSLFVGRKFYQSPQEAYRVDGAFEVRAAGKDYLRVTLRAAEGPLGTQDYRISVQAAPVEQGTLVRLSWGYEDSWRSRMATSTYLATLGRDKVGFTVIGEDRFGRPEYVQGVRGMIERNAMRYYLALRAYLETDDLPERQRLEASMAEWYRLVAAHARQLHELERDEYLNNKRREWANQRRLQREISAEAHVRTGSAY